MLEATFGDVPRYRMLDTCDRSASTGSPLTRSTRLRWLASCAWARSFARWVDHTVTTADEPLADRRLLAELGNLRAAWHHARSADDLDLMASS